MSALTIRNLTKTYANGVQALKGIDLQVEKGDFFALLGPNGAGKSTTIGVISSLVNKTGGEVSIFGYSLDTERALAKQKIGVVPQEFNFNQFEKVFDIVVTQAGFYGIPAPLARERAEKYLRQLGLWEKRDKQSRTLSGGMKRRLMIARALVHEPELLILDEPTAGVDIELRRSMWDFLIGLNNEGRTIILTTHYLEEAETLCRRIAIIDHGRLIASESTESLVRRIDTKEMTVTLDREITEVPAGLKLYNVEFKTGHELKFSYPPSKTHSGKILEALSAAGLGIVDLTTREAELEDIFLSLTGGTERDGE